MTIHFDHLLQPTSPGESFEGQAVLVLGQGNAALETAQELQRYTSELHLLARGRPLPQGGTGVRLAYQTHYVTLMRLKTSIAWEESVWFGSRFGDCGCCG